MDINNTLKKLRKDLSLVVADIDMGLHGHSREDEGEFLAVIQDSLQRMVEKLDAKMAKRVTRKGLADFLNNLLETEYDAVFSYSYHALSVLDKELSKELFDFGITELRHFELLRDKIVSLGVEPRWKLTKYMECSTMKPVELLRWHLNAEQKAIDICREGIEDGFDNVLEGFLQETINEEQAHIKRLNELIEAFDSARPCLSGDQSPDIVVNEENSAL